MDRIVPERDSSAYTVTLLDRDGRVRKRVEREVNPMGPTLIAPSADGGFWTLRRNGSQLPKYTAAGERTRSLHIVGDGFEPWTTSVAGEGVRVPPRPHRAALADLGGERLIVLDWIADADWKPGESVNGFIRPATTDYGALFDTVLLLVDARSGRALERTRVKQALQPVSGAAGLFYSAHEDAAGHAVTQVWRLTVDADLLTARAGR